MSLSIAATSAAAFCVSASRASLPTCAIIAAASSAAGFASGCGESSKSKPASRELGSAVCDDPGSSSVGNAPRDGAKGACCAGAFQAWPGGAGSCA
jgi:hypothetical protein